MERIFLRILNMSLSAGAVIALVLLARLALRRAPKKWSCLLWLAPAFRLLCPVSFRASFSLFQLRPPLGGSAPDAELAYLFRLPPLSGVPQSAGMPVPAQAAAVPAAAARSLGTLLLNIAIPLWCLGAAALLVYAVVSWQKTRARLSDAVRLEGNIYASDRIDAPFLLGLWRPRIYLPAGLEEARLRCVLAHERVHLRRRDPWVMLLAFFVLAVHWFNPLVWLAFFLLRRDLEMSCDEKVLAEAGSSAGEYSRSLLSFAAPRRFPLGPLAFGETGVKERIRNALRWKRPRTWVTLAALLLVIAVTVICAANPITIRNPWVQEYIPGQGNIRGAVDTAKYLAVSQDFAIGASADGYAVFKDPYKALRALSREFGSTLRKLRVQNLLPPLGYGNYRRYLTASARANPWAVTEEEIRELAFIRGFFDIYENSFQEKHFEMGRSDRMKKITREEMKELLSGEPCRYLHELETLESLEDAECWTWDGNTALVCRPAPGYSMVMLTLQAASALSGCDFAALGLGEGEPSVLSVNCGDEEMAEVSSLLGKDFGYAYRSFVYLDPAEPALDPRVAELGPEDRALAEKAEFPQESQYRPPFSVLFDTLVGQGEGRIFACVEEGTILGYLSCVKSVGDLSDVDYLQVREDRQREGIGTALARAYAAAIRREGGVPYWSNAVNDHSANTAEKSGFTLCCKHWYYQ